MLKQLKENTVISHKGSHLNKAGIFIIIVNYIIFKLSVTKKIFVKLVKRLQTSGIR